MEPADAVEPRLHVRFDETVEQRLQREVERVALPVWCLRCRRTWVPSQNWNVACASACLNGAAAAAARSSRRVHFLRQFVVDERLLGRTPSGAYLEQAVSELLGVRRARTHLSDEFRRRVAAAFLGLQRPRDPLYAAPDGDMLVGRLVGDDVSRSRIES